MGSPTKHSSDSHPSFYYLCSTARFIYSLLYPCPSSWITSSSLLSKFSFSLMIGKEIQRCAYIYCYLHSSCSSSLLSKFSFSLPFAFHLLSRYLLTSHLQIHNVILSFWCALIFLDIFANFTLHFLPDPPSTFLSSCLSIYIPTAFSCALFYS